jgi:hypothetical protein
MKKTILNVLSVLVGFCALASAQTVTTNTTLAAAMLRGDQTINLTSSTGVLAAGLAPSTGIYVDREYMTITANSNPNSPGALWGVKRGAGGTLQTAHASGATVWVGVPSNGPFDQGPIDRVGACTAGSLPFLPVIQVRTGNIVYCANGQYGNFTNNPQVGTVLASQAGVMSGAFAITAKTTHISGTNAITGFTVPPGLPDGGSFTLIPDGNFTVTNATNVAIASTAVTGKALVYTWDRTSGKLYPSY